MSEPADGSADTPAHGLTDAPFHGSSDAPVHGTWEPAPAARWEDAFLSGNGRHGVMVFGDPNDDRVIVNHHTLVRPNGSEAARPPELAARLKGVQGRLLAGDVTAGEDFTDGRPLLWVQPFHPAFQVRLLRTPRESPAYRREVDFTTGVVRAECGGRRSEVFVSRADDVIVQHVTEADLTVDVTLDHRLPGVPSDVTVGHSSVLTAEGALLTLRARYPGSERAFTGVTLAVVTGGRTRTAPPGIRIEGARSVLLLTRVRRHKGSGTRSPRPVSCAPCCPTATRTRTTFSSPATPPCTARPTCGRGWSWAPTRPNGRSPGRSWSAVRRAPPCSNGSSRPVATTCCPPPEYCRHA